MEYITEGLLSVLTVTSITVLLCGLIIGFITGAMPGFDAVNAAAIVLPFTVHLDAQNALVAMAGIYAGTAYAGAIPAILLNVPGTAGAAATALDGYPMARKGEAARAISIARGASMIGGVMACLLVLPLLGPISQFALEFTSPEMFLVGLIAMTIIGSLIGDSIPKGMLALFLGMLLATMAASGETGRPRFNFGLLELYESFPFVPVTLGVFALAQMFIYVAEDLKTFRLGTSDQEAGAEQNQKSLLQSWREASAGMTEPFKRLAVTTRSSLVGLGIGILPGTGPTIANFVAYGIAKRRAKRPEEYGQGTPDGIIAPEAADNSCVVGTLVPTFTLGIPGSATAAVMMGAAMMQGWAPGPAIMRDHAVEVYTVLWGLLIAALAIGPTTVVLAAPLAKIATTRREVLTPCVILLSLVGAFAVRNSLFDIGLAILFGFIGVLMRRTGFPVVPMVLGLILAPIIESNFIRSMRLSHYSPTIFFDSTLALILWAVLLLVIAASLWGAVKRARLQKEVDQSLLGRRGEGASVLSDAR
ncbi:MAG TPA: tripartite tricarboxylate transporter permease [Hyphomicrobiaceae bacterium]